MKRIFTLSILIALLTGCSKDFLKSYEKRIIGTWRIADVDRTGIGGSTSNLPFREGTIHFNEDGGLTYTNASNDNFQGTWDITKREMNERTVQSLQITAVDFTNQQVRSEFYDDINFISTDRFKATTTSGLHTYITEFRRYK